jgi:two-component system, NarL family, sensor histidine kinase UhpB
VALSLQQNLPPDLGPSVTLALYRVVQEGVINALRHSQASQVQIGVGSDGQRIVVTLCDNGIGLPSEWSRPGHFGLRGLTERVEHLGGTFNIGSTQPHGVTLRAEIPLAAGAPEAAAVAVGGAVAPPKGVT